MALSISEISGIIESQYTGDPDKVIQGVSGFQDALDDHITFAGQEKFYKSIQTSKAGAIIVPKHLKGNINSTACLIFSEQPKIDFFKIVSVFHPQKNIAPGIHQTVQIGKDADIQKSASIFANVVLGDNTTIGRNVVIMANTVVGDGVSIGDNTTIHPNVTILDGTQIGSDVIIHPGAVIGSDGYGFAQQTDGHTKLCHAGSVQIGDRVEIGANTTIDRGTIGKTIIGSGVKIDNLVHIAHNVTIGENTLIVAQVGIAGSTRIGPNAILAGKAGISGHISIGANAIVGPYTGVHSNVKANEIVSGIPQVPHERWKKIVTALARLPEMRKKIFSFNKRLNDIEQHLKDSSNL